MDHFYYCFESGNHNQLHLQQTKIRNVLAASASRLRTESQFYIFCQGNLNILVLCFCFGINRHRRNLPKSNKLAGYNRKLFGVRLKVCQAPTHVYHSTVDFRSFRSLPNPMEMEQIDWKLKHIIDILRVEVPHLQKRRSVSVGVQLRFQRMNNSKWWCAIGFECRKEIARHRLTWKKKNAGTSCEKNAAE